ncbi:hypothetical protein ABZ897_16030 [Nonomuraea sp. NPDC046802]|uniref:hypothetical protein n=1 Tax=Nonomuraea sp. NPDC046802 TaxID=3154919 RepID=UPI0033D0D411
MTATGIILTILIAAVAWVIVSGLCAFFGLSIAMSRSELGGMALMFLGPVAAFGVAAGVSIALIAG